MKTLTVDFHVPPPPRMHVWALLALLAVAALSAAGAALHWKAQAAELQQRARAAHASVRLPVAVSAPLTPPVYAESANLALGESGDWWLQSLLVLERVSMQGVTPTSLETSAQSRSCRVELEFSDYAILLEYLAALDRGNPQPQWSLDSAQLPSEPGRPGRAVMRRSW